MRKYQLPKIRHLAALSLTCGYFILTQCVYANNLPVPYAGEQHSWIDTVGNKMTIACPDTANQVLKWASFSIGEGCEVAFEGTPACYLNYVKGNDISQILGTLNGVGKTIYLINPHGIQFGQNAAINAGSFIAATKTLDDAQLENFDQAIVALQATGDVVNTGATLEAMEVTLADGVLTFKRLDTAKETQVTLDNSPCTLLGDVDVIEDDLSGKYVLGNDVTVTAGFGTARKPFTGELYGAGHTVTLDISSGNGLFAQIGSEDGKGGKVQDLALTGNVKGANKVGALAGRAYNADIADIINHATVEGSMNVGGVVGYMYGSTMANVENTGNVSGSGNYVGGIVGQVAKKDWQIQGNELTNVKNSGHITGRQGYVGGIIGYATGITMTGAENSNRVIGAGNGSYIGGIVGNLNNSDLNIIANTGEVSGKKDCVGGIVGYGYNSTITDAYNAGAIGGTDNIGGIAGEVKSDVSDGFVITRVYNAGTIRGDSNSGPIVGAGKANYNGIKAFYLDTSYEGVNSDSNVISATQTEMTDPATYISGGWEETALDTTGTGNGLWRFYTGESLPLLNFFLPKMPETPPVDPSAIDPPEPTPEPTEPTEPTKPEEPEADPTPLTPADPKPDSQDVTTTPNLPATPTTPTQPATPTQQTQTKTTTTPNTPATGGQTDTTPAAATVPEANDQTTADTMTTDTTVTTDKAVVDVPPKKQPTNTASTPSKSPAKTVDATASTAPTIAADISNTGQLAVTPETISEISRQTVQPTVNDTPTIFDAIVIGKRAVGEALHAADAGLRSYQYLVDLKGEDNNMLPEVQWELEGELLQLTSKIKGLRDKRNLTATENEELNQAEGRKATIEQMIRDDRLKR